MRALRRLARDQRGLSGIEFAIILPVIMLLLAGTVDLGFSMMVNRRVHQIATTTSDIVSQEPAWTSQQLTTLLDGVTSVLDTLSATPPTVQISVLDVSSTGATTVNWSYGYNTAALAAGAASPVTIPASIKRSGVQLVVTVVRFNLTTILTSFLTGRQSYAMTASAIARPRVGDTITRN